MGHVKTDLDSVAGALGAAALWRGNALELGQNFLCVCLKVYVSRRTIRLVDFLSMFKGFRGLPLCIVVAGFYREFASGFDRVSLG